MAVTIAGFFLVSDRLGPTDLHAPRIDAASLRTIAFFWLFTIPAGVAAAACWMLFHRKGRRPGWPGYALLALVVVVVSHVLVFGSLNSTNWIDDFPGSVALLTILFLLHGWLSVPVALLGTAMFVLWQRRHEARSGASG